MTLKFHSSLTKDLSSMLDDSDDYNAIIKVGVDPNIKEFHAHSNILRARSPYFKSAFSNLWIKNNDDKMIEYTKPNINPDVFEIILEYIYTGEVDLTEELEENILGLLIASDELLLEELFESVQEYLINKKSKWVEQNFILVLHTIYKLSSCKKLQDHCIESICLDPQPFITSENFLSLDKDILYNLLKRDDLAIEEIIVWDHLIKWGIEQTPGLGNKNNIKWNNKNFQALKKTLNGFIPLIRFTEINSADFFDKIRPFKAVIPNVIYEEVMEIYMKNTLPKTTFFPPRRGMIKIDSNIIKPRQSRIIINWIDKKNSDYIRNREDTVYKFNLIYRQSRNKNSNIRDLFAGQGAILIFIKEKFTGRIFGGYNPIGWRGYSRYQYLSTIESFIFSFENNEDTKDMEIGRVLSSSHAIYDCSESRVVFGKGDLKLKCDKFSAYNKGTYECLKRGSNGVEYEVEEIEAFSVVNLV